MMRGFCVAHNWQANGARGYGTEASASSLSELRGIGANWVSLTPFGFMESLRSGEVHHVGERAGGETDARMVAEIGAAHERELAVMLKPHLWIAGGAWRAEIEPPSWEAWFDSYREWILRYARMAEAHDVEALVIGTELRSSLSEAGRWRALIAEIRGIYRGQVLYSANWDSYADVTFWSDLDWIGVQFYPPIAESERDSIPQMRSRLRARLEELRVFSDRFERPIVMTEMGYRSTRDCAVRPFEWAERSEASVSEEAQDRAFRVFFAEVQSASWLRGIFIWKWFSDVNTNEEGPRGFFPRGKLAEQTIRQAFAHDEGS